MFIECVFENLINEYDAQTNKIVSAVKQYKSYCDYKKRDLTFFTDRLTYNDDDGDDN